MSIEPVLYSIRDGVARISLNDPDNLNAMSERMAFALHAALKRADGEARAVIVTGEGRGFSSGANLEEMASFLADEQRDLGLPLERIINPLLLTMRTMRATIVSAVRGPAAGVGCALALAADIIIASEDAYFLQPFCHVGLIPDGASSWLLTQAVGRVRAMQMMLLGEKVPATRALDWGLISRVVREPELEEIALQVAHTLADGPKSLEWIKQIAWSATDANFERAIQEERIVQRDAGRTADFIEGMRAFGEKRKPAFTRR